MKTLLALSALFLPFDCVAQSAPLKGANTIVIQTRDSASVALRKLTQSLISTGSIPDNADAKLGYITTRATKIGNTVNPAMLTINGVVSDAYPAVVTLTGMFTYSFMDGPPISAKTSFAGGENGPSKRCFRQMEKAAKAYEGAQEIRYEVR